MNQSNPSVQEPRGIEEDEWCRLGAKIAAIFAVTDSYGRIIYVNEKFEEISEYTRDELFGCTHAIINSGYHSKEFFKEMWRCIAAGNTWRGEICNKSKSGRLYWVDTSIVPLKDPSGRVERYVSVRFDITQRKELEHQITLQSRFQAKLLDIAPVGIFRADVNGFFRFINRELCELSGLEHEEAQGLGWFNAIHPEDREAIERSWNHFCSHGQPFRMSWRFVNKNQEAKWVQAHATEVRDEHGQIIEYIGTLNNVTDSQRAQAELERISAVKGMFMANISHEIRTPLNAIIGLTELLITSEGFAELPCSKEIEQIKSSSDLLLSIINDVLDLSKIESGKLYLEVNAFDLHSLISSTLKILQHQATGKNLNLVGSISPDLPRFVFGDELRLKQIFLNLLSNALKFTESGGIELQAKLDSKSDKVRHVNVSFSVRDSGIGMSEEQVTRLFKPFSQADLSISKRFGGTGLGLSISRRLCEMMGGTISVESNLGEGSCFTVRLELEIADDVPKVSAPPTLFGDYSHVHCLIAEDYDINQKIAESMLKKFKIKADIVENGSLAVEAAQHKDYQLIFMDMQMPVLDGLEATHKIRQEGLSRDAWIVALTANAFEEDRRICVESGMNDFLAKPISLQEMHLILHRMPASKKV